MIQKSLNESMTGRKSKGLVSDIDIDDLLDDEGWDILNELTEEELELLNADFDPESSLLPLGERGSHAVTTRHAAPMFRKEDMVDNLEKIVAESVPVIKNEKIRKKEEEKQREKQEKLKKQYPKDKPDLKQDRPREVALTQEEENLLNEATEEELIEAAEKAYADGYMDIHKKFMIALELRPRKPPDQSMVTNEYGGRHHVASVSDDDSLADEGIGSSQNSLDRKYTTKHDAKQNKTLENTNGLSNETSHDISPAQQQNGNVEMNLNILLGQNGVISSDVSEQSDQKNDKTVENGASETSTSILTEYTEKPPEKKSTYRSKKEPEEIVVEVDINVDIDKNGKITASAKCALPKELKRSDLDLRFNLETNKTVDDFINDLATLRQKQKNDTKRTESTTDGKSKSTELDKTAKLKSPEKNKTKESPKSSKLNKLSQRFAEPDTNDKMDQKKKPPLKKNLTNNKAFMKFNTEKQQSIDKPDLLSADKLSIPLSGRRSCDSGIGQTPTNFDDVIDFDSLSSVDDLTVYNEEDTKDKISTESDETNKEQVGGKSSAKAKHHGKRQKMQKQLQMQKSIDKVKKCQEKVMKLCREKCCEDAGESCDCERLPKSLNKKRYSRNMSQDPDNKSSHRNSKILDGDAVNIHKAHGVGGVTKHRKKSAYDRRRESMKHQKSIDDLIRYQGDKDEKLTDVSSNVKANARKLFDKLLHMNPNARKVADSQINLRTSTNSSTYQSKYNNKTQNEPAIEPTVTNNLENEPTGDRYFLERKKAREKRRNGELDDQLNIEEKVSISQQLDLKKQREKPTQKTQNIPTNTRQKSVEKTPPSQNNDNKKEKTNNKPKNGEGVKALDSVRGRLRSVPWPDDKEKEKKEEVTPLGKKLIRHVSANDAEGSSADGEPKKPSRLMELLQQDKSKLESKRFESVKVQKEVESDHRGVTANALQQALLKMNGILTNEQINSVWEGKKPEGESINNPKPVRSRDVSKSRITKKDVETELDVCELVRCLKEDTDDLFYICINNQPKLEKKIKTEIFKAVEVSQKVKHLSLAMTGLIDSDVKELANVIRYNKQLETLNLESNVITMHGIMALMKEVRRHPNLREIKVSNQKQPFGLQGEECMAEAIHNNANILKFGYSFMQPGPRNKADRAIIQHNENLRQRRRNGEDVYDLKAVCKIRDPWPQPWIKVKGQRDLSRSIVTKVAEQHDPDTDTGRESRGPTSPQSPFSFNDVLAQRDKKLRGSRFAELEAEQERKRKQQFSEMEEYKKKPTEEELKKEAEAKAAAVKKETEEKTAEGVATAQTEKGEGDEGATETPAEVEGAAEGKKERLKAIASLEDEGERREKRRTTEQEEGEDLGFRAFDTGEKKEETKEEEKEEEEVKPAKVKAEAVEKKRLAEEEELARKPKSNVAKLGDPNIGVERRQGRKVASLEPLEDMPRRQRRQRVVEDEVEEKKEETEIFKKDEEEKKEEIPAKEEEQKDEEQKEVKEAEVPAEKEREKKSSVNDMLARKSDVKISTLSPTVTPFRRRRGRTPEPEDETVDPFASVAQDKPAEEVKVEEVKEESKTEKEEEDPREQQRRERGERRERERKEREEQREADRKEREERREAVRREAEEKERKEREEKEKAAAEKKKKESVETEDERRARERAERRERIRKDREEREKADSVATTTSRRSTRREEEEPAVSLERSARREETNEEEPASRRSARSAEKTDETATTSRRSPRYTEEDTDSTTSYRSALRAKREEEKPAEEDAEEKPSRRTRFIRRSEEPTDSSSLTNGDVDRPARRTRFNRRTEEEESTKPAESLTSGVDSTTKRPSRFSRRSEDSDTSALKSDETDSLAVRRRRRQAEQEEDSSSTSSSRVGRRNRDDERGNWYTDEDTKLGRRRDDASSTLSLREKMARRAR